MKIFEAIFRFIYNPDRGSYPYPHPGRPLPDHQAFLVRNSRSTEDIITLFQNHFGNDFHSFFYRQDFGEFIRKEVFPLHFGSASQYGDHLLDRWASKNPLNFPGPFYTGESDTCGTGPAEAPGNVLTDSDHCEYVFRQPQDYKEFICVLDAAAVEVYDSYSCDGNQHWTLPLCREWWHSKPGMLEKLQRFSSESDLRYIEYLNTTAGDDLRRYCYFLDNGKYPSAHLILPELS